MTERIVRASSLSGFQDCPRRFAATHLRKEVEAAGYTLRDRTPSTAGALVGTGVHSGAAFTLQRWTESGGYGAESEAIDAAVEGFRERAQAEGAQWDDATPTANAAEKQIARMTRTYRREVAPNVRPVLVEQREEAEFAPGWILSGQLDALAEGAPREIRDTKTGRVSRNHIGQLGAYGLIYDAHGYRPERMLIDFIRRVPVSKDQPPVEVTEYDAAAAREEAWETLQAIRAATEEFERRLADPNGLPPHGAWRANPSSQMCGDKWCPAWGTGWCKVHRPAVKGA